jgi:hypothetical protein
MRAVDVAEGQTATLNFDMRPDPSPIVEGHVIDPNGNPVPGATVLYTRPPAPGQPEFLEDRSVTTDATGRFKLRGGIGTTLKATYKNLATQSPTTLTSTGGFYTLQLAPRVTFDLTVKVVDESGSPVAGATAGIFPTSGGMMITQPVSADGSAKFEAIGADTRWSLHANAPGYGLSQLPVRPPRTLPRIVEMKIVLKKADQVISGTLVDDQGNPLAGLTVAINGPLIGVVDTKTDAQGRFKLQVAAGTSGLIYIRDADDKPLLRENLRAKAGETDLKLVMPAATQPTP